MTKPAFLATHIATDPQGVLSEAKDLVDYKDWASGHYADALGNITTNAAMMAIPGGAEAKPAITAAEMESRAASAAAQVESRGAAGGVRDAAGAATHAASATEGITTKAAVGPPGSTCPDGQIGRGSTYTALTFTSSTMCFLFNQFEGRCYGPDQVGLITLTDCAVHRATLRIIKQVDGSTDGALCPANTEPFPFVKPARLYCAEVLNR